ncbi:hypothetical protein JT359_17735 [Candidatus Poribacteria bacterium]|nr:hypothetical protein [Candidatus Poribacteria bacterium]
MLELQQQQYSNLQTFENRSKYTYSKNQKYQIQRNINPNTTPYFSSFSNFNILHLLIKSFVNPTTNRVYRQLKNHYLKSNLKNLKNLNSSKNLKTHQLQTKQIHKNNISMPAQNTVKVNIIKSSDYMIHEIDTIILSKWTGNTISNK